jgi:peroxiredoxin
MNKVKHLTVLIFVMGFMFQAFSQKGGYNIKVKINGIKDTSCYIAGYYGEKQYLKDTAKVDSKGNMVFTDAKPFPGGIYMLVTPNHKYFEFIINKEQSFSMETDTVNFAKNMKVKGSPENKLFYDYLNYIAEKQVVADPMRKDLKNTKNPDSIKLLQKKLTALDDEVKAYKLQFMKDHPETFLAKVFKTSEEVDLPEPPVLPSGKKDSAFVYHYYKAHFFDFIDFSDDRLLRTPVFHNKIKQYITQVIPQMPDSIDKEADYVIEKARANKEVFKYVVWYITNWSETCNIMGMDAVFVHMVDTYYSTNQAYWVGAAQLEKIINRGQQMKYTLLGTKATNLIMADVDGKIQSLNNVKAKYTILYFWDPDCGHCQKETPVLLDFYHKMKPKGFEVFAVGSVTNLKDWKKFIIDKKLDWINVADTANRNNFKYIYDVATTPVVYLLDEDKRILSKGIRGAQLEEFIERRLKLDAEGDKKK